MPTEHPILFTEEMVLAILDGRKTQTRRVVRGAEGLSWFGWDGPALAMFGHPGSAVGVVRRCPYGLPGDHLWVREAWRVESFMDGEPIVFGYKDGAEMEERCEGQDALNYEDWYERVCIQSTEDCERAGLVVEDNDGYYRWDKGNSPCRWRPSIHMPRWASRITLEVVSIALERVRDISHADVIAEGGPFGFSGSSDEDYAELWDRINGKRGYPWSSNPWVWVIEFAVVSNHAK